MLRVALTGGIASGKSAAAAAFRALGVPVIDADTVARDFVAPGSPGLKALTDEFGEELLTASGQLDRDDLRERIFRDAAARERVNRILHPLILAEVERQLAALQAERQKPYAVVEIPLLAEARLAGRFDRVVVVDVPEAMQVARLKARDGSDANEARAALSAQASRQERLNVATDVLDNSGDLDALARQVRDLHERLTASAKGFATPRRPRAE